MEISECLLLPKLCNHMKRCMGYTCRKIGAQQCVHAVIHEGKLQVMYGRDLYKLIDKDHPEYEHLYKLYDTEYLDTLRQVQRERDEIRREKYRKELLAEDEAKKQREFEKEALYLAQANMTSEMKVRRTAV